MRARVRDAAGLIALIIVCGGGSLVVATFKVAAQQFPLVFLAMLGGGLVAGPAVRTIRDRQTRRRLAADGWRPVPAAQPWPWQPLLERPDQTTVHRAWARTVDGLPLAAGEISWDDNALNGSVTGWAGRGVFVVVKLPAPTEPMALRRPHRTIGASHRLDFPAMRAAFEAGEIPPWTARDDRLFTFEAIPGQLRAGQIQEAVRRTLLVVRLLDLGPD
jgi:hypothetical protein